MYTLYSLAYACVPFFVKRTAEVKLDKVDTTEHAHFRSYGLLKHFSITGTHASPESDRKKQREREREALVFGGVLGGISHPRPVPIPAHPLPTRLHTSRAVSFSARNFHPPPPLSRRSLVAIADHRAPESFCRCICNLIGTF